jgi:hypothetical protein
MKSDKAKNLSKESSTAEGNLMPKPPVPNSTGKDRDLASTSTNGEIEGSNSVTEATKTFANSSSVLFDAVYVPGGAESIEMLKHIPNALRFIEEAYKQGKVIAASGEGVGLVKEPRPASCSAMRMPRKWGFYSRKM